MSFLKQVKNFAQNSAQKFLAEYIDFNLPAKQLTLKEKTVLILCEQAQSRVEQITSLSPAAEEGLIAQIEHQGIKVELHFTPEKITLYEDYIEGQIRLLKNPNVQSDSVIYRYLIAGWNTFLGGKIPSFVLPKPLKIEGDKITYTLPREQNKFLEAFFSGLKNGSTLTTSLKQG